MVIQMLPQRGNGRSGHTRDDRLPRTGARRAQPPMPIPTEPANPPDSDIRLVLLHAPRLQVGHDGGERTLAPKDAALLALLALDGPTLRTRVAALLWPDADPAKAHNNLRQRAFRMRRLAGRDVVEMGHTLKLAPHIVHDLADLEPALRADAAAAAGELLGTHDFADSAELAAWVDGARQQWRAARRDLLAELAARHEREDHIAAALLYAERLARDEPLLEHAQRHLMRLHYRRGDRGAALQVYERLKNALDQALGETPSRETQEIVALIEAAISLPVASPPQPVAVLRPPRLVGREREWAQMQAAWAARRVLLVRGEPGIGKSRLVVEFAQANGVALYVQGRPGDQRTPYATLARLVRAALPGSAAADALEPWMVAELARVVPELGAPAGGVLQPLRLHRAVEQALAPTALAGVVLDDLHFVDDATLDLLPKLIDSEPPTRWILAVRAAEVPQRVRQWLAGMEPLQCSAIDLEPLSAAAVEGLLASLAIPGFDAAHWAPRIHRHTGGNPMFILETLLAVLRDPQATQRAGDRLPVPANLGEMIVRRLEQLSPPALKLARIAAIAGPDFTLDLAAHVAQVHPLDLADAWQELERAQVVRDQAFAHDLVLESVLASLPGPIARWLHAAVAGHAAEQGAPPGRTGAHWRAAGEPALAAKAYLEAGKQAADSARVDEQIAMLEQAADLFEAAGDTAGALDALRWLVVGLLVGRPDGTPQAMFERMAALAGDDFERGEVWRLQAIARMTVWDFDAVIDAADRALPCYGRARGHANAAVGNALSRNLRAVALARLGRRDEALAAVEAVRRDIAGWASCPDDIRISVAGEHANVLIACDRRDEALSSLEAGTTLARQTGFRQYEHTLSRVCANALLPLGRVQEAHRRAAHAVALQEEMGASRGVALHAQVLLGWACRDMGWYGQAIQRLEEASQGLRESALPSMLVEAEHQLSLTWLQLGRFDRMEQVLTPVVARVPGFVQASRVLHRAWLAAAMGRPLSTLDEAIAGAQGCAGVRSYERLMLELLCAARMPAAEAGRELLALAQRAEGMQLPAIGVLALAQAAQTLRSAEFAIRVLEALDTVQPWMTYAPAVALRMFDVLGPGPAPARVRTLAEWSASIQETARSQVPEPFRDSFLHRNPVNRDILALAANRARR